MVSITIWPRFRVIGSAETNRRVSLVLSNKFQWLELCPLTRLMVAKWLLLSQSACAILILLTWHKFHTISYQKLLHWTPLVNVRSLHCFLLFLGLWFLVWHFLSYDWVSENFKLYFTKKIVINTLKGAIY